MAPAVLLITFTILYPLIYALGLSFFAKHLLRPLFVFVGYENYVNLVTAGAFWDAVAHSLVWTFYSVGLSEIVGFLVALVLNQKFKGRGVFRGIVVLPWATAAVIVCYLWLWLVNDMYGVMNYILQMLRLIKEPVAWFGSPHTALLSLVVVNVWKSFPFVAIVLLAGLQAIPVELYESAKIDGASRLQEIRFIVLPSLRHIIYVTLLLMFIWNFNHFDLPWVMTEGGPGTSTTTLPILAYRTGFKKMQLGESAAISTLMFIVTFTVSMFYLAYLSKREKEEI